MIYFDGGCVPNPGSMHVCVYVNKDTIYTKLNFAEGTNNLAEWVALIWACKIAIEKNMKDVVLIGDSKLVVSQANGLWKIKHQDFLPFKEEFDTLKPFFSSLEIKHVLREYNLAGHVLERHGA